MNPKIKRETTLTYSWDMVVELLRQDAVRRLMEKGFPAPDLDIKVKIESPNYAPTILVSVPDDLGAQ